jgi:hypothetical protein
VNDPRDENAKKAEVPATATLHGAHLRTLEALFRHPTAHNLEWMDVIGLLERIGSVQRRADDKYILEIGGEHLLVHKPHTKDLTSPEVVDIRHLLQRAGWSPQGHLEKSSKATSGSVTLVVTVDHHEARVYRIEPGSDDSISRRITPYDPHHFLHHLAHKDQSRQEGQRAPEDFTFYQRIGDVVASADRVLVVGHASGKSNAAQHLMEYLRAHHREAYQRVVREISVDLSAITAGELVELAERTFGEPPRAPGS